MTKPAKGTKGFLLYNPITHRYFFRVYDLEDKSCFKDYKVLAEDIEVEIVDDHLEFYENEGNNCLDYSPVMLGKENETQASN